MKKFIRFLWVPSLALLIVGCAAPAPNGDALYSEWRAEELLPPTGREPSRVYVEPASYPDRPNIVAVNQNSRSGDSLLGGVIRRQIEYNRGLAPSLSHVVIVVRNGHLILEGSVKSDLDARVIVDDLRDIVGVTEISDQMQINPYVD